MFKRYSDNQTIDDMVKTGIYVFNKVTDWVSSWFRPKLFMDFYYKPGGKDDGEDSIVPLSEVQKAKDELHQGILEFEGLDEVDGIRASAQDAMSLFYSTTEDDLEFSEDADIYDAEKEAATKPKLERQDSLIEELLAKAKEEDDDGEEKANTDDVTSMYLEDDDQEDTADATTEKLLILLSATNFLDKAENEAKLSDLEMDPEDASSESEESGGEDEDNMPTSEAHDPIAQGFKDGTLKFGTFNGPHGCGLNIVDPVGENASFAEKQDYFLTLAGEVV